MKRLLMITSAIGLCLSAPAFAQTAPEPEQLNKQQAAPPSTSAPAAQSQDRQRSNQGSQAQQPSSGSSPSSAQAPASQDQKDQAQKQPSGGSSSSSAQAPASQDQKGQAQNQSKPSDSTTKAQLPADQKRSATDRKQRAQSDKQNRQSQQKMQQQDAQSSSSTETSRSGTERSSGSAKVSINDDQRTRIAAAISSTNVRSVNVNFRIATGVVVPRTVVLHALPASIIAIVPQYRGYRYFVTNDEIVIVEPRRKTIVATLPAGGTARAQAPASAKRISFSEEHREVIRKRASTLRSSATTGASTSRILVEQEVPATIELQEFPAEIVTEVPVVRGFRFFRQDNDVFVVDPAERRVIEIIR